MLFYRSVDYNYFFSCKTNSLVILALDMQLKELTKAEESIMQELWSLEKAFVKDLIQELPEPKPAYNTVSTIIRILEEKGYVGHEAFGKAHRYFPLISKEDYAKQSTKKLLGNYFGGSVKELLSFFVQDKQIDLKELDNILKEIEKKNQSS
jgi:BlaI family penicillinase repressor